MTPISENTSKRITSLRFLLMLFVMIKHNALVKGLFMRELPFEESKASAFIKEFFANGLGELAVPVFFIFSAYLFAMSQDSYFTKLKKRFYSVFVPYSIWTVFYFAAWLVLKKFSIITGFVNPCMDWREWTFKDYFLRFVGYNGAINFPFVGSFWFLRDLMLLFLISPVLLFFTKKFPLISFLAIALSYFMNLRLPVVQLGSVFYFTLGMLFAVYKIDFFEVCDKIRFRDSLLAFVAGFCLFLLDKEFRCGNNFRESPAFFLFVISGIVSLLKVSKLICEKEILFDYAKKFAPLTFFIYAFHAPVLCEYVKSLTLRAGMPSLIQFSLACILDIGLSVMTAMIFRKIFPAFFEIINGGKREK